MQVTFWRIIRRWIRLVMERIPFVRDIFRTAGTACPITMRILILQKLLGFNRHAYWPVHPASVVGNPRSIRVGIGTSPGLAPGCYLQAINGIEIGDYSILAPNVGLISANHDPYDITRHIKTTPIRIGNFCWIGMNAVILPGVELGDHTIVAAGAVVSRSFPEGYCILAGVPAKIIKKLAPESIVETRNAYEYIGYHYLGKKSKDDIYRRLGVVDFSARSEGAGEKAAR